MTAALHTAAASRDSQQLLLVRRAASRASSVTCAQLLSLLSLLGQQGSCALRCGVIVALWSKLLDRSNLVTVRVSQLLLLLWKEARGGGLHATPPPPSRVMSAAGSPTP